MFNISWLSYMQGKKWENGRANETISAQSEINHWKLWQFQPSQVIKENMTGAWEFWFQYANVALLILNWAKRLKQSPAGGRGAALCSSIIASQLNICSRGPFEKASILLFLLCASNTYKIYIRAHTHTHTQGRDNGFFHIIILFACMCLDVGNSGTWKRGKKE